MLLLDIKEVAPITNEINWEKILICWGLIAGIAIPVYKLIPVRRKGEVNTKPLEGQLRALEKNIDTLTIRLDELEKEVDKGADYDTVKREIESIKQQALEDRKYVFELFKEILALNKK